ncbi:MAG TPA: hypothetical protein VN756_03845 [Solirubrobacterales bacterium]|nr:hypothetical protein [Solirubrobacterales bacterium]
MLGESGLSLNLDLERQLDSALLDPRDPLTSKRRCDQLSEQRIGASEWRTPILLILQGQPLLEGSGNEKASPEGLALTHRVRR